MLHYYYTVLYFIVLYDTITKKGRRSHRVGSRGFLARELLRSAAERIHSTLDAPLFLCIGNLQHERATGPSTTNMRIRGFRGLTRQCLCEHVRTLASSLDNCSAAPQSASIAPWARSSSSASATCDTNEQQPSATNMCCVRGECRVAGRLSCAAERAHCCLHALLILCSGGGL